MAQKCFMKNKRLHKKAIMGVGTLIILIAMILVSAVAAGVVINSAGSLQSKANVVAKTVEDRLVNGIETVSLTGYTDSTMENMDGIEIMGRLKPASQSVNLNDVSIILSSENFTISPEFTSVSPCTFSNINPDTEFCSNVLVGNNDTVISPEEIVYLRFALSDTHTLQTNQEITLSIIAPKGDVVEMRRTIPSLVGTKRVEII